jgi:hypothetical protein
MDAPTDRQTEKRRVHAAAHTQHLERENRKEGRLLLLLHHPLLVQSVVVLFFLLSFKKTSWRGRQRRRRSKLSQITSARPVVNADSGGDSSSFKDGISGAPFAAAVHMGPNLPYKMKVFFTRGHKDVIRQVILHL